MVSYRSQLSSVTRNLIRSGDVSRAETTSTMVLRSQVRDGRHSAAIPVVESRQEMESRQNVETPAEVDITVPINDEGNLGTARPRTGEKLAKQPDSVSKFAPTDKRKQL